MEENGDVGMKVAGFISLQDHRSKVSYTELESLLLRALNPLCCVIDRCFRLINISVSTTIPILANARDLRH